MTASSARTERCAQCLLPLRGRGLEMTVGGERREFCCYGCYLVLRITRRAGAGGEADGVLLRLGLAVFFAMNAMMFSLPAYFPYIYETPAASADFLFLLRIAALCLTIPVLILLGIPVVWQAVRDLRQLYVRTDALIALGTVAAFAFSVRNTFTGHHEVYFDTVAMLLILVAIGRYLEARGRAESTAALGHTSEEAEVELRVERAGATLHLTAAELRAGDVVEIGPGDACPVDGEVVSGCGRFDESTLTGEAEPQLKESGAEVFAGTVSLDGCLRVRAVRVGTESATGRVERLVADALLERGPLQRLADRLASGFIPVVLLIAAGSFLVAYRQHGIDHATLTLLSVLVVSCPCAFGLAAPTAIWTGLGEAARRGVLIKSAAAFETLALLRTLWLDRTGTLTEGRMVLEECRLVDHPLPLTPSPKERSAPSPPAPSPKEGEGEKEVLRAVRALERQVPHPLARALSDDAAPIDMEANNVRYHAGCGVEGSWGGRCWYVGSRRWLEQLGVDLTFTVPETESGRAVVHVAAREANATPIHLIATLTLADRPRAERRTAVNGLRSLGLTLGVLTGGARRAADADLGPVDYRADLTPAEKVEAVRASRGRGPVGMAGDGLNDAGALAAADVGIAIGTGRALVREAADVNLVSDDISVLPWMIGWARQVRRTMLVNFCWAFFYNGVALAFAATGRLNPIVAALAMIASSTFIVLNGRRLRKSAGAGRSHGIEFTAERSGRVVSPGRPAPVRA